MFLTSISFYLAPYSLWNFRYDCIWRWSILKNISIDHFYPRQKVKLFLHTFRTQLIFSKAKWPLFTILTIFQAFSFNFIWFIPTVLILFINILFQMTHKCMWRTQEKIIRQIPAGKQYINPNKWINKVKIIQHIFNIVFV